MSASSHIASGTNADQRDTTPFRLPTAARKSVFHTLYLTEQCAPVIRDAKAKSGKKPALVPAVEDAVEDTREKHVPATRLLDSDQHIIKDEPSDDNSTVNGDELAGGPDGDGLLDAIAANDSNTLRSHTSLSFTTSNTAAGYRSDSNGGSAIRYRSGSASWCAKNRSEVSGDALIVLDDDGWEDTRTKASTPAPRGRDMRRMADLYDCRSPPYMSRITTTGASRHSGCKPSLLGDDINDGEEATSLVWSFGVPPVPVPFPTVEYSKPDLQEVIPGQRFRDLGISIEGTAQEASMRGTGICYKSKEKDEGRSGIHASNLQYPPLKYYDHRMDRKMLARDYTEPMGKSDFWRISGSPVGPNAPRTYLTKARPFLEDNPTDNITSREDVSIDSSVPRSSISTLPDVKKDIPVPNETVEFKMRILRSYKEWGLPVREQANQYTNRLIEEAERARKNGVIIPGLEESLNPIAFRRPQASNPDNPEFNMKRLDVYLYHAPNNLRLADISFALQNTGSLQFIRYSKSKGEIHIRFVHEWSAHRFATGKTNVQLPLPDGTILKMDIMLAPPATYPHNILDIPEPLSRKLRLGPIDTDLLGEMASEVAPAVQVNLADPHALVEAVVNAFCVRGKVIHFTQFQTTAHRKAVFRIEFANINDAVMFKDSVIQTGVISPYKLVYEPDP